MLFWLPFAAMGYGLPDALLEVVSATGTTEWRLAVGLTSSTLPLLLKGVFCVDILPGRLDIIIKTDKDTIDELSEEMDCSFLHGDGSQPNLLGEVNPKETDFLFCLTDSDQANVISSMPLTRL